MPSPRRSFAVPFFILIICGFSTQHLVADAPPGDLATLASDLDKALRRGQTGETFYVARVVDLRSGKELYAVDPDKQVIPASNGKISVTAAALDFFGPDHLFKTWLALDGEDLWLIGSGDPGVGDNSIAKKSGGTTMTVLDQWADALEKSGVKKIKGDLIYYDREFDDELVHPSWSKSYITEWYAAPISGLNFNNNCIDISVKPTRDGEPVEYKVIPQTSIVTIKNECKSGTGRSADVDREEKADVFTITGASTRPADLKSEAVTNPPRFFADALKTHLARRGITIEGKIRRAGKPLGDSIEPPKGKIVAVHETKMADALARINKNSQNNFAEAFCKYLGRAYAKKHGRDEPGSWKNGQDAIKAFLKSRDVDPANLILADGSGLSRENRVTTRIISDIFVTMWNHPHKQAFFDSLTIGGVDGTIGSRFKDHMKGRVRGKTGFIGGVRSLSGYVENDRGNTIVFSIIFNGIDGSVKPYEDMQDNACRVLAAWPRRIDLPPATRPTTTRDVARVGQ